MADQTDPGTDPGPPIYTKTGDDGSTGTLFGGRLSKGDPLVEAYGTVDEAVAALGLARAATCDEALSKVMFDLQRALFVAGADLATNPRSRDRQVDGITRVDSGMVARLEAEIDRLVREEPLRPAFVVPGATLDSAALDLARTILRRAERRLVAAIDSGAPASPVVLAFLNRASDLLYVMARRAAGPDEPLSHE